MTDDEMDLFVQLLLKFLRAGYQGENKKELDKATFLLLEWANEQRNEWQKENS